MNGDEENGDNGHSQTILIAPTQPRTTGEVHLEVETLCEILRNRSIGEVIPYDELSQAIGRDVQGNAHHILEKARTKILRENEGPFDTVPGIGVKRLNRTKEALNWVRRRFVRIENQVEKGRQELEGGVDFQSLNGVEKTQYYGIKTIQGMLAYQVRQRMQKMMQSRCEVANHALPPEQALIEIVEILRIKKQKQIEAPHDSA